MYFSTCACLNGTNNRQSKTVVTFIKSPTFLSSCLFFPIAPIEEETYNNATTATTKAKSNLVDGNRLV